MDSGLKNCTNLQINSTKQTTPHNLNYVELSADCGRFLNIFGSKKDLRAYLGVTKTSCYALWLYKLD